MAAASTVPAPPPRQESFTAIDSPSLQFLPRHQEAPGWQLEDDPMVVPSDRMTTYLDDDAAHFMRYEAVDVSAGRYAGVGHNGFATVEIFRFPDFVKAFGAYSMRKTKTAQYLPIANEAFQSKHTIHLWRGPFYVRVIGTAPDPLALRNLAAFVAERMPAAAAKPAVFNFFPTDTRVISSERFSTESGFGLAMLANSFQATFNIAGDPMEGLVIPAANRDHAAKILNAYRALYVRNGKLLDPIANLGEDNFTAEDKFMGRVVAFRIDRFVIAFNGYKERQKLVDLAIAADARILGTIRKQLVKAEKDAEETVRPTDDARLPPWVRRN